MTNILLHYLLCSLLPTTLWRVSVLSSFYRGEKWISEKARSPGSHGSRNGKTPLLIKDLILLNILFCTSVSSFILQTYGGHLFCDHHHARLWEVAGLHRAHSPVIIELGIWSSFASQAPLDGQEVEQVWSSPQHTVAFRRRMVCVAFCRTAENSSFPWNVPVTQDPMH